MIGTWLRLFAALAISHLIFAGLAVAAGQGSSGREMIYDARQAGNSDIFVLDVQHMLKFNLTRHEGGDSRPAWSPDGRYIAFESWRDGTRAVYVMDANGGNVHRLTNHTDASEYAPEWTADGNEILFRYYKRPDSAIYRAKPDGSNLRRVEPDSEFEQPLAHDRSLSTQFVDGVWGIFVTEGEVTRRLTSQNILYQDQPQWSADGHLVALLSQPTIDESEIYVIDSDSGGLRQITSDGVPKGNLSWRPY